MIGFELVRIVPEVNVFSEVEVYFETVHCCVNVFSLEVLDPWVYLPLEVLFRQSPENIIKSKLPIKMNRMKQNVERKST